MLAFNGNKVACIKILKCVKYEPRYENLGPVVQSIVCLTMSLRRYFVSSPEPKAHGELIVYQSSRRPCIRLSTLSNMIISTTSRPIPTKFYLKHQWGGG